MAQDCIFQGKHSSLLFELTNYSRHMRILDKESKKYLEEEEYVAIPKVTGFHALLLCESQSGHICLISKSRSTIHFEQSFSSGTKNVGFLLETKVFSSSFESSYIVIVYDICSYGKHRFKKDLHLKDYKIRDQSYISRYRMMKRILEQANMKNVHLVPLAPSHEANIIWEKWRNLPYAIDGVIFHPYNEAKSFPVIKWEPQNKQTINVVLGDVLGTKDHECCFKAYLFDESKNHRPFNNKDNCTLNEVVLVNHSSFVLKSEKRYDELYDCFESAVASVSHPTGMVNCQHTNEEFSFQFVSDQSEMESQQSCICHRITAKIMPSRLIKTSPECVVWVPSELMTWVYLATVEVSLPKSVSVNNFKLEFRCIRHDKERGMSIEKATSILYNHLHPSKLTDINFKVFNRNNVIPEVSHPTLSNPIGTELRKSYALSYGFINTNQLFVPWLPSIPRGLEQMILEYLTIPELVKCRKVSNVWRNSIDTCQLSRNATAYFGRIKVVFDPRNRCFYRIDGLSCSYIGAKLSRRSVAAFLHMGGIVHEPQWEDEYEGYEEYASFGYRVPFIIW